MIYSSVEENKFIYACRGYNNDYNLYTFNSNFEPENIVNNDQYKINYCPAVAFTLIESFSEENKLDLITSCKDQGLIPDDFPDRQNSCTSLQSQSPHSTSLPTTSLPTTSLPSTSLPTTSLPTTSLPTTSLPTTSLPSTSLPTTSLPTTSLPTSSLSTTSLPTTSLPTTSLPTTLLPTSSLSTTSLPTTFNDEFVDTTNLSKEKTYLTTFEEETSNVNQSSNKIYSTQLAMPSTDINIDTTKNLAKIATEDFYSTSIADIMNTTESSKNETCPEEYPYQHVETKECLKSCSSDDLRNKKCKLNFIFNSNINSFTENIRNLIKEKNLTSSDTNIILDGNNTTYQIISSNKMQENENTNISIIDLGECEKILLDEYNLSYLLILKIDSKL